MLGKLTCQLRYQLALVRLVGYVVLIAFCMLGTGLLLSTWQDETHHRSDESNFTNDGRTAVGVTLSLEALRSTDRRAQLDRIRKDGFQWVRIKVDWSQIEPAPGEFRWAETDTWLNDLRRAGLETVAVLTNSPRWARHAADQELLPPAQAPPAEPAKMIPFVREFAQRHGNQLQYYQIWHEPNVAPNWGNRHVEPVEYARLLFAVGKAIREVDSDAAIITAALAPTVDRGHTAIDEVYFLYRLYSADRAFQRGDQQRRLFDAVAIQPFGFAYAPDHPHRQGSILNFQRAAFVRRAMLRAGDAVTPLWATRFGWNRAPYSPWKTVSPEMQVAFTKQAVEMASRDWPWLTHMGWPSAHLADGESLPGGFGLEESLIKSLVPGSASGTQQRPADAGHDARSCSRACGWGLITLLCSFVLWRTSVTVRQIGSFHHSPRFGPKRHWHLLGALAAIAVVYHLATWPPLILLCLFLATLIFLVSPLTGLLLASVLVPFQFQHKEITVLAWSFTIAPAHAALLCLLPALIRKILSKPVALQRWNIWDWLVVSWVGIGALSAGNGWHPTANAVGLLNLVIVPALFYGVIRMWKNEAAFSPQMASALFTSGVVVAAIGLLSWWRGYGTEADGVHRLVGPHFSPNHTALYLERTLFVGIGLAAHLKAKHPPTECKVAWVRRLFLTATLLITGAALVLTASRGSLLFALPAGLLVVLATPSNGLPALHTSVRKLRTGRIAKRVRIPWLWVHDGAGLRQLRLQIIGWLVISLVFVSLLVSGSHFRERLTNRATLVERLALWRSSVELWQDYPLTGVGAGGFFWHYPAYTLEKSLLDANVRHPHNVWLEIATMSGVLGLIWFGCYLVQLWKLGCRGSCADNATRIEAGLLAGLVAGLAHGQVDAFGALADLATLNWIMVALLVAEKQRPPQ